MSCDLSESRIGRDIPEVKGDLLFLHHQVVKVDEFELPYSHPDTFAVFAHILEHPETPASFRIPGHCLYAGKQRVVTVRWQPQYPMYPLAIGTTRIHARDLSLLFAYLCTDTFQSRWPETIPDAYQRFIAQTPETFAYNTKAATDWFEQRLPFVEELIHTHHLSPEQGGSCPAVDLLIYELQFAGHVMREARKVIRGRMPRLVHELDNDCTVEERVATEPFRYVHIVDLPYLERLWPPLLSIEQFAQLIGVSPEHIQRCDKRFKPELHPTTSLVIQYDKPKKRMARCWRCSRLLTLKDDTSLRTDCACGAANMTFNSEVIVNAAHLPDTYLMDVEVLD